jgi:hypothetical protein
VARESQERLDEFARMRGVRNVARPSQRLDTRLWEGCLKLRDDGPEEGRALIALRQQDRSWEA